MPANHFVRLLHRAWVVAALTLWSAATPANEPASGPLVALRQGAELSCQSPEPYFCENMHVRCAGRTTVATFPFTLRAEAAGASVVLAPANAEGPGAYQNARVEWADDQSYLLLTPRAGNGYVKVLADGKYVFRHYIQSRGVMSLGQCR